MKKVSVVKCESYEKADSAVRKSLALIGGIDKFVKKGDRVLIKPNMLGSFRPEEGVTTHPAIVRAVINIVKEKGAKICVGDSPAIGNPRKVAKTTGILNVCKETGAEYIQFDDKIKVKCNGKIVKSFEIAKIAKDVDVIINLPKCKTHSFTLYTGAIKNMFGIIPGLLKTEYHVKFPNYQDFSEMLIDLYSCIKPTLNIMDAVVSMEGAGPTAGKLKKTGLILASDDAVELDTVVCSIANLPMDEIALLTAAKKRHLGGDLAEIEIVGEKSIGFRFSYETGYSILLGLPMWAQNILKTMLLPKPIITDKCIACGQCVRNCPVKTITIEKKAVIGYSKCIRCFCCHEVCPERAVRLKHFLFFKPMLKFGIKLQNLFSK